jgi:hypothetical protein
MVTLGEVVTVGDMDGLSDGVVGAKVTVGEKEGDAVLNVMKKAG